MRKLTTKEYVDKANIVHDNKYSYVLVNYVNKRNKVIITCPIHGNFTQQAGSHLRGVGCPKCMNVHRPTTKEFIEHAISIHGNKYDYKLVKYINNNVKVKILCKEHGEFEQRPADHLSNKGCPICRESKGEREIAKWLDDNGIKYLKQHKFSDCKHKKQLPFDFYLPEHNTCIEYHGRHHYEPVPAFGGDQEFESIKIRDEIKEKYCYINNINLIAIKYNDSKSKQFTPLILLLEQPIHIFHHKENL